MALLKEVSIVKKWARFDLKWVWSEKSNFQYLPTPMIKLNKSKITFVYIQSCLKSDLIKMFLYIVIL